MEDDEKRRETLGVSASRKCMVLVDYLTKIKGEGRCENAKHDADRILQVLKEDAITSVKNWNADTVRRYLSVGTRCDPPSIKTLLLTWETLEKRNALIDSITVLRACMQATTCEDDLQYVLHALFMEQRCGIRKTMKTASGSNQTTPANTVKALLARRSLWAHLKALFPKFEAILQYYSSFAYYADAYGVDSSGSRNSSFESTNDSDNDAEDQPDHEENVMSSYKSRPLLVRLASALAKNSYERLLVAASKDSANLDLSSGVAAKLNETITAIKINYNIDFPPIGEQVRVPASGARFLEGLRA
jgi:hypothetical protein